MQELIVVGNPRKKKSARGKGRKAVPKTRRSPVAVRRSGPSGTRSKRSRPKRRNPRRGFNVLGVDVVSTIGGAGVATVSRLLPGMLAPRVGVADEGVMSYVMQLVSGFGLKYLIGDILKQRAIARKGLEYTMVNVAQRVIEDYVLGATGLGGYMGLQGSTYDAGDARFYDLTDNRGAVASLPGPIVDASFSRSGRWPSRFAR